jgi:YesN/AraC family two-component response regulator
MTKPDGFSLTLNEGDVWYLPKNQPYGSVWTANGYVEFYCFEFETDFFSTDYTLFEKIENTNLKDNFISLHTYFENQEKILALCEFYKILSVVTPLLTKKHEKNIDAILPALNFVYANYDKNIKVSTLAELCHISEPRFFSLFKALMKQSPINYKNNIKTAKAIELLQSGYTLEKICEKLGYSSPAFLRTMMKKYTGLSPKLLKKGSPL